MIYTEQQINSRINSIKVRFTNFERLTLRNQYDSGIYFLATDPDGREYHLRLVFGGTLFHRQGGEWCKVDDYMYHDRNEK